MVKLVVLCVISLKVPESIEDIKWRLTALEIRYNLLSEQLDVIYWHYYSYKLSTLESEKLTSYMYINIFLYIFIYYLYINKLNVAFLALVKKKGNLPKCPSRGYAMINCIVT